LDFLGSRLGVHDSLDRDDMSTSVSLRKPIPDRLGVRSRLQRFGEIVRRSNLVAWPFVASHIAPF
jgi:hypothetical protein